MKRFILMFLMLVMIFAGFAQADSTAVAEPSVLQDGSFWAWLIGGLIAAITYIQHAVPTSAKAKSLINIALKVLEIARWLILKIFPDRKKDGGVHEEAKNPLKKEDKK